MSESEDDLRGLVDGDHDADELNDGRRDDVRPKEFPLGIHVESGCLVRDAEEGNCQIRETPSDRSSPMYSMSRIILSPDVEFKRRGKRRHMITSS